MVQRQQRRTGRRGRRGRRRSVLHSALVATLGHFRASNLAAMRMASQSDVATSPRVERATRRSVTFGNDPRGGQPAYECGRRVLTHAIYVMSHRKLSGGPR